MCFKVKINEYVFTLVAAERVQKIGLYFQNSI